MIALYAVAKTAGGGAWILAMRLPYSEIAGVRREESYLIVACTVMTDVPEAVGP
jgi:hypothetical protein